MATGELKNLDVLHCQNGDHEWTRLKQKGRKPRNCSKHPKGLPVKKLVKPKAVAKPKRKSDSPSETPVQPPKAKKTPLSAMQRGKAKKVAEDRQAKIAEILEAPNRESCDCQIHPEISDKDLYFMKGCRSPSYTCPTLVRVRNAVGLHDATVDTEAFWRERYAKVR